jgi:HSP20 family protein
MARNPVRLYGPLVELSRLQSELNRLFQAFVDTHNRGAGPVSSWDPSLDVLDDGKMIRVLLELPGVEPEDVRVTVRGRVVTIRGQKKGRIRTREGMRFFCMERFFGNFVKSVPLPRPVNTREAKAFFRQGLLEVALPRVPDMREKEHEIPVKSEDDE